MTHAESACWFSGITINKPSLEDVSSLCQKMREKGIDVRNFWKPIHVQAPYVKSPCAHLKVAELFWFRILTLPCSTNLTEEDQKKVINVVSELL